VCQALSKFYFLFSSQEERTSVSLILKDGEMNAQMHKSKQPAGERARIPTQHYLPVKPFLYANRRGGHPEVGR
jgi:hypothetical protein